MPAFTFSEKTDMVCVLSICHGNQREAARLYRERFPDRRHPDGKTIWRCNHNLRAYGVFRKPSVVAEEVRRRRECVHDAVLASMYANPHESTRNVAENMGISQRQVVRILHNYHFHPYRIHLHQGLHGNDFMRRETFCVIMRDEVTRNPSFLERIIFSDEATFQRDGTVNRHNCHYWAASNPYWLREDHHQIRWKVNVWCGILGDRIIGPYFIEGHQTCGTYLEFLQGSFTEDVLDDLPLATQGQLWFQQDGHPAHNSGIIRTWLNRQFGGRWIGTQGRVACPARSPDLTPLDYFLWVFVKSRVYETPPQDVEDLQNRIRRAC